jgi:transposase, IS30 family
MARGEFITDATVEAGTYRKQGTRWLVAAGGVRPRRGRCLRGRCLTLAQREEIALGRARGQSVRSIAAAIGRSPSTVSRELRRSAGPSRSTRVGSPTPSSGHCSQAKINKIDAAVAHAQHTGHDHSPAMLTGGRA